MSKDKKKKLKLYYVTAKSEDGTQLKEGFIIAPKRSGAEKIMEDEYPGMNNAGVITTATRVRFTQPGFLKHFKEAAKELA